MVPSLAYPIPADEEQRLRDLARHRLLGIENDEHFHRIVELASSVLDTPIAAISLIEADRQWFLAGKGIAVKESPREDAFCAHTIAGDSVLVVPDALADERFRHNPLVRSVPHIRFYAGAPLRSPDGHNLGTLCVIDREPRQLGAAQLQQLQWLADLAMRELELRRQAHLCPITGLPTRRSFLRFGEREFQRARREGHALALFCFDIDNFRQINQRWGHHAGDLVLLDLCRLCSQFLREQDSAGRLGDEEFALLLVDTDTDEALALAEGLRRAISTMPGVHSHSDYELHISGGLTSLGSADHAFTDMLHRADRALELAKSNGRNQIACLLEGA